VALIFLMGALVSGALCTQAQNAYDVALVRGEVIRLHRQGKYVEAVLPAERYISMARKLYGENDVEFANAIAWRAELYHVQGRYAEAEPLYKRALGITENALGSDHPEVGNRLNGLALLYHAQARYADAEPLYKRSLAITENSLGPDHPEVGTSLNNLAALYENEGRYGEAEALYIRALAITERALGPDEIKVAIWLNNLAGLYRVQGRFAEAEPIDQRALAITEKALGPDHQAVSNSLTELANLYLAQDRYAEAEPLYERALAISRKALGPAHPEVGVWLSNLANLYTRQGRFADAERLYMSALAISETALGPDHPDVGQCLNNLALQYFVQRDWARAADYWRRSTGVTVRRARRGTNDIGRDLTGKSRDEAEQDGHRFFALAKSIYRLAPEGHNAGPGLTREAFQAAQWVQRTEAADSLAQMAARGAKGDARLSPLVRERQDLVAEWQKLDGARTAAVSQAPDKRDRAAETATIVRLAAIDARIADIDKRLKADFPDYAALSRPEPLSVEEVQSQLRPDEALALFLDTPEWKPTPEETFIWVVTKMDVRWARSELGTPALTREVAALRCGLDAALWDEEASAARCRDLVKTAPQRDRFDSVISETLPFDTARAHALYKALFGANTC
jgi:tetratricopeptide (TPR) repeat protein